MKITFKLSLSVILKSLLDFKNTFYFEMTLGLQVVAKIMEFPCILYLVFPNDNILHKPCTF